MTKVRLNCGTAPDECTVDLFSVYNTSHREMLVLARDKEMALRIAGSANHFYALGSIRKDKNYPRADIVGRPFGKISDCWNIIQEAASRRMEGTVHIDGRTVAIGHEIVTE